MVLGGYLDLRPFVGAATVRAGLAKKAHVPRVYFEPGMDDGVLMPHHKTVCEVLRRRGVPEKDVVLLGSGLRTTYDEANCLRSYLAESP